jgi:cyclic beta-1,2-glucan synthetase
MNLIITTGYIAFAAGALILLILYILLLQREKDVIETHDALLGPDELERHAVEVARNHIVEKNCKKSRKLIPRLRENFRFISEVYKSLNDDARMLFPTVSSAEWLLDNYYVIEEQVKDILSSLSRSSYCQLPILRSGYLKGYPRVYAIALELVTHTDGEIDEKLIKNFLRAYQSQTLLSMGELWVIAIMLRIALIENIRQICEKIIQSQKDWHRAEDLSKLLMQKPDMEPGELADVLKSNLYGVLNPPFVEHLIQRLRRSGTKTSSIINYLDTRLAEQNLSAEAVTEREHQLQAARQVSIGNSITSVRLVATLDWNEIFETLSQVEAILRCDPSGIYDKMDFDSRDYYRHQIERYAKLYGTSEVQVARKAVECAREALEKGRDIPAHIGYYLIGSGKSVLQDKMGSKPRGMGRTADSMKRHPVLLYMGVISLGTITVSVVFAGYAARTETQSPVWMAVLAFAVVLIPVSDLVISLVNCIIGRICRPTRLPKLELKEGIPQESSTMVIIPTLLPNEKRAGELLDQLEVIYLANSDPNLYFALVGDYKDSAEKQSAGDEKIRKTALEGIARLNNRYSRGNQDRFYYFHRHRTYNKAQEKWIGWERKRGAITEFNDLLRGSGRTGFSIRSCDLKKLPSVKYVITLDADTNLPMGAAKKLVGAISHPMNRAVVDKERGVVTQGYGLLQPRISVNIINANSTLFSRIFAGQGGIDPYTTAVSDVYQDLFGEGIFTGKGIYDVDVFEGILKHAIPENTVLSHDLLEGSYVRTGLVTDIEMVDGYPSRYNSYAMRLHRWVRGDWQLVPWLFSKVRNRVGERVRNPLSPISRWKIFDNLRRSLMGPATLLLILLSFGILSGNGYIWLSLAIVSAAAPVLTYGLNNLLRASFKFNKERRHSTVIYGFRASLYQTLLLFTFIPYQAYLMINAIVKTLVRVYITRRNMLEWVTAADVEASLKNGVMSFWRRMWISLPAGLLVIVLSYVRAPGMLVPALLLFAVWLTAPLAAYWISKTYVRKKGQPTQQDLVKLRRLARKTWAYYEDFAVQEDHYLPPDNYQEEPTRIVAHRTSPTNIGMLFMAILCARDLGYIGSGEFGERVKRVLDTMERMDRWKGHFYNWYDTETLKVLRPLYVSTVDSGNLIGYLMVLAQALREYAQKPVIDMNLAFGLRDTILLYNGSTIDTEPVIDTSRLDEYISRGEVSSSAWQQVLNGIHEQLGRDGEERQLWKSPWRRKLAHALLSYCREAEAPETVRDRIAGLFPELLRRTRALVEEMEFKPLFDEKRQLFSIGYNVEEGHLSKSYYDLLASEARQASYIAIARGEVDQRHWFRLGRKLALVEGYKGLISWTGTMFEYLMPPLIMRSFENTLLDETYHFVVRNQKRYGEKRNIPWGVSESGYNAFDISLNYQYKAFGIPQLGLKRGLENDLVIAPYATILALGIDIEGAMQNIARMEQEGLEGDYGFYEAVDYTPSRQQKNRKSSVIRSFMAHHQGMSIVALTNFLFSDIMQERFHADPVIRAAELLLQERVPLGVTFTKEHREPFAPPKKTRREDGDVIRTYSIPSIAKPEVHILSNGSFSVMVTKGGSGYSKLYDTAVARWMKDIRSRNSGIFIYIQNLNSNHSWTAAFEPYNVEPEKYKVIFSPDKAEFIRKDGNIETRMDITVSPEDNAEIRRVSLTNYSNHPRELEVTSYFEVVLAAPEADIAHPAFSNLFIRTEFLREYDSLLASRRPREEKQQSLWAMHTVSTEGQVIGDVQYETDRMKFIGRNRELSDPAAMDVNQPLSNSEGAVLDPVMSLRRRIRVEPGRTVRVSFITAVAENRKKAMELADKYHDPRSSNRAFELAWTRSQIESEYMDLEAKDVELYFDMVPALLFPSENRRAWKDLLLRNSKGQPHLWPYGVSGDVPVILLNISSLDEIHMVFWILKAHEFWRAKGLLIDLVIFLEYESSYIQPLQDAVRDAISASHARELVDRRGGVFIRNAVLMPEEDKILFQTVARIVLKGSGGPVKEQFTRWMEEMPLFPLLSPRLEEEGQERIKAFSASRVYAGSELVFFNGIGGFSMDGREYVINLREGQRTPAPWTNVISNPHFGFQITESGGGFVWSENSRENKLTPWTNDPVTDMPGEIIYIREEQTGSFWTMTPMPVREPEPYVIRHGHGYTVFEHTSHGLEQQLTVFAAEDDSVKISHVKLTNITDQKKRFALIYYIRPVLGVNEQVTSQYVVSQRHTGPELLTLTNSYNKEFEGRVAFMDCSEKERHYTGDRLEFLGENGSLKKPEALGREKLSGRLGAGYDPCAAIQVTVDIEAGREKEVVFLLGQCQGMKEVLNAAARLKKPENARKELARVKEFWDKKLNILQVCTPDASMNILVNSWLVYQVITCRLWSRSAFYQSGGAFGFRDQLQDVMAVTYSWPELMRRQILLHAAHQYIEGDVQHWWHAEVGKGIRTRYSDDLVWLPYVTADYIENTGDWSILDEEAPYLESEPLREGEDERYEIPRISEQTSTLYEHCLRSLEKALHFGERGIPLMGSGDWNDGMNTVGNKGRGESVWLGWFLHTTLQGFVPVCRQRGDEASADKYARIMKSMAEAIEANAWDGSWYRRAYFDDGTPLGSAQNSECSIDSLSQSWSAISGVGRPHRVEEAMNALDKYLIDRESGLIKLLTPPFDNSDLHPGYIKGYVPGVRENGGQYTHAAVWVILACARMGKGDSAWELFHLINPINHTRTSIEYSRYKLEPYVVAADVYAVPPHTGRGGWSWYTGAAGWMYRTGAEHILGIKKRGDRLVIDPCIPANWHEYSMIYRLEDTVYKIAVKNPEGVSKGVKFLTMDGSVLSGDIPLLKDGKEHAVEVIMGR